MSKVDRQGADNADSLPAVCTSPLTQHDPGAVTDRGDQEHPAGGGDGPAQQFPVDRGGAQQPDPGRMSHPAVRAATLFPLGWPSPAPAGPAWG